MPTLKKGLVAARFTPRRSIHPMSKALPVTQRRSARVMVTRRHSMNRTKNVRTTLDTCLPIAT